MKCPLHLLLAILIADADASAAPSSPSAASSDNGDDGWNMNRRKASRLLTADAALRSDGSTNRGGEGRGTGLLLDARTSPAEDAANVDGTGGGVGGGVGDDDAPRIPQRPLGDSTCPCLSAEELESRYPLPTALPPPDANADDLDSSLGPNVNLTSYGVGCSPHDLVVPLCADRQSAGCAGVSPLPPDCDRSWCLRSWCFVDPSNCGVMSKPSSSPNFIGRHFSYSTCGYMDSFTYTERLRSLRGQTFRVAFNSNSGGWRGAYHPTGRDFAPSDSKGGWGGPIVNFVRSAALEGGFLINVTRPPEWLMVESEKFFGKSSFDFCVYATALGYLDMCIAAYTLSDKRASVTTFFETADDPIYLVTFNNNRGVTWKSFTAQLATIFQPFTVGSWLMIILLFLPVLGLLMLWHEHGAPGSAYPKKVPVMIADPKTGVHRFQTERVSMVKHVTRSLYQSFLSFCQASYDQSVVTVGGKINLLAISSFILLVIAVYTANLAAILTSDINKASVSTIDEAIAEGYNFCSSRRVADIIVNLYSVPTDRVVPDPIELGGDGGPGFSCPDCHARTRIFEYMRRTHDDPSLYCNAAFASLEDLEVLQASGQHCDKAKVGDSVASRTFGIPIREAVAPGLLSLFHQMKNDGLIDKEMAAAQPESRCPVTEGEGNALTVEDLTGIWIVTFSFALAGILAKLINVRVIKRRAEAENAGRRARTLQRYDQWGNPTNHEIVIKGRAYDLNAIRELLRTESSRQVNASLRRGGGASVPEKEEEEEEEETTSSVDSGEEEEETTSSVDSGSLRPKEEQWEDEDIGGSVGGTDGLSQPPIPSSARSCISSSLRSYGVSLFYESETSSTGTIEHHVECRHIE